MPDDSDFPDLSDAPAQPPAKPFAGTLGRWAQYNLADSKYQAAMAAGGDAGAPAPSGAGSQTAASGQTPSDRVHVIVDNNTPVIGDHVGVMVGDGENAVLWDPGGGYAADRKPPVRGEDATISGANADLEDYVKIHKTQNGPNVNVYDFPVTPGQAQQIKDNINNTKPFPGWCAVDSGNALRGIGPFSDLGPTLTPSMMDSEMKRLRANNRSQ